MGSRIIAAAESSFKEVCGMKGPRIAIASVVFMGSIGLVEAAGQGIRIPAGASVYIDKMDSGFDTDIQAELTRQKVALKIVSSADDAQLLIVGVEKKDLTLTKEQRGLVVRVRRGGTVTVRDKASSSTRWSDTWQVGSYNPKDQRKAASRLVEKLKKSVGAVRE